MNIALTSQRHGQTLNFEDKAPWAHRPTRTADSVGRSAADAQYLQKRSELITPFNPCSTTLRRVYGWQFPRNDGPCLARMAHHEAGHVVLMAWLGVTRLKAEATATYGSAHWPPGLFDSLPAAQPDPTGIYAATAAAVYHAGAMAEMLHAGSKWIGPLFYPQQSDYTRADDMLQAAFGRHASGAHAYAQKVALNVLSARWARVQEIASHLVINGAWQS